MLIIEQAPVETCEGTPLDIIFYNLTAASSNYKILFTAGNNQLPTINNVSSSDASNNVFNSLITINGNYACLFKNNYKFN